MANSRSKLPKTLQKAVSNKIAKLIREGYSSDQAAAIAYKYARAHKLGPLGGLKRNPDEMKNELVKIDWLKEPITWAQFDEIHDYYNDKFVDGHVRWFDDKSGEGFVRLDEGPLKDASVFVHGSAFGGDQNFGQNTDFEATNKLPVKVKVWVDLNYLQIQKMKKADDIKKNPRHELEREFSTALYMVSKKPSLINKIPENIRELFEKAGYVRRGEITSDGEKFLKFIKSRVASESVEVMKNPRNSGEDKIHLLIDSSRGIYIPRTFYRNFDFKEWGLDILDYPELDDVNNEHYWDAWDDLMNKAEYKDKKGHVWRLHQDDDLFAIRDDYEFED